MIKWKPIALFNTLRPRSIAIPRVGLMNRLIMAANAFMGLREGKGVRIHKADSGWVIEADVANLDDGLGVEWLKICKDVEGTTQEYWIKVRCSGLYNDNAGVPGSAIAGHPYTDAAV